MANTPEQSGELPEEPSEAAAPKSSKEKFRELLERKKAGSHGSQTAGGGPSKIGHSQGAKGGPQMFRRKSGG